MFKRFFGSRIVALWLTMTVIGFFIGYAYSIMDVKRAESSSAKVMQGPGRVNAPPAQAKPEIDREEETE